MTRVIAWALVFMSIARPLDAQRLRDAAIAAGRAGVHCGTSLRSERPAPKPAPQSSGPKSPWAIAASAVLPGTGQALLDVNRAMPYLGVEAFAWAAYVRHSQQYRGRRDAYRDLAARVARAAFASIRPHGDFEYYERMTHYAESGRYDVVAGGSLDPEVDSTTYNGAVWLLARKTFWTNPAAAPDTSSVEWRRAVAFYQTRAYDQSYRWSWTHAPLEYSAFVDLIGESNDANRRAMVDLGVIIANHVLSMVDAYITVRLRHDAAHGQFAVEAALPLPRSRHK